MNLKERGEGNTGGCSGEKYCGQSIISKIRKDKNLYGFWEYNSVHILLF